ncbi:MAG: protein kinase [Polyangiaceae bacterium]|nr:protein kinase [Polyangiaceae bacterium]
MAEQQPAEKLSPSKQAARRVGSDLNDKWRIDRVLGVGGMGAVFAATHKNNGTRAAIKVLHVEYSHAADVRERFLREGKIANRVDHLARVQVVDDGVSSVGEPFLVMELLEGMTLAELFKRSGGRVPLTKILGIFDTVLDLLAKCHEIDVIHRDIKPANIFLTKQGGVKVLDFGVARMREPEAGVEATRAGIALGTASFIAPEQALGMDKLDGRADLFSVGACLYTGITGERLHASKTEAEEFVLAATQAAPSVSRKAPDLPVEIAAFIDKALSFDRAQRHQSAREMRAELLKLVAGLRTGQVKQQRRAATGVVVKGNDSIDEGPELTDNELREQKDRLTSIFKHLGYAMAGARQYGMSHPQTQRALGLTFADIGTALAASAHSVRWDVTSGAFSFEEHPVWVPDRVPFDRIPHQLYADGIRKVQLKPGLTEEELRDFIAILLRDVSTIFGSEDDSVTALWDRRFEHIAYLAVDSFAEGDNLEPERVVDWNKLAELTLQQAKIDKDFDDTSLEGQALEHNLISRLESAGEAAASLAIDPMTVATLGAQLSCSPERWQDSFLDAFVPAYLDAKSKNDVELIHKALEEWTQDEMALNAVDKVFELHEHMTKAFITHAGAREGHQLELETAKVMFPVEVLRTLMSDIAMERRGAWGGDVQATAPPKALVSALGRALDLLASDSVFALACECLDSAKSDTFREVIVPYIRRWSSGHEATLIALLSRAGPALGTFIIELLIESKNRAGLESALSNPNIEVKLAALAAMGEHTSDRAKDELSGLLEAPEVPIRMRALDLVGSLNVVAAGPFLVRRVQSDAFHELSAEERKKSLSTICTLKPARGEALAVELLSKRRLLSNDASETSRAIAAETLADFDSAETIEALQVASKQRWGTSSGVREAALKALAHIDARRAKKDKAGAGAAMEGKA